MPKTRRVRCPYCGFLDVIKWGKQCGHQRYRCKNCDSFFTHRREDISKRNRFIWFKSWVRGKQTIEDISEKSGYSVRQLKYWFHEYLDDAPTWTIQRRKSVNLLIDGTWFPNKVCLVVYRADNVKATLFYRITDEEKWVEIESDLQKIKQMGIRIASVTSDGSEDIIKAVRIACPHAVRQRCLAHIERECLVWLTQHPRTSAGIYLRRLVCQISHIKTHNDRLYWISEFHKLYEEYEEFINQKAVCYKTKNEQLREKAVHFCLLPSTVFMQVYQLFFAPLPVIIRDLGAWLSIFYVHLRHLTMRQGNQKRPWSSFVMPEESTHKNPSQNNFQEGFNVLRTGIELYVIIN